MVHVASIYEAELNSQHTKNPEKAINGGLRVSHIFKSGMIGFDISFWAALRISALARQSGIGVKMGKTEPKPV